MKGLRICVIKRASAQQVNNMLSTANLAQRYIACNLSSCMDVTQIVSLVNLWMMSVNI